MVSGIEISSGMFQTLSDIMTASFDGFLVLSKIRIFGIFQFQNLLRRNSQNSPVPSNQNPDLVDDWIGNLHDSSVFGSDYYGGAAADHLSWPMLSIFLLLCAASFVTYRCESSRHLVTFPVKCQICFSGKSGRE